MKNIPMASTEECIFSLSTSEEKVLVRQQPNYFRWMIDLEFTVYRVSELVPSTCPGTSETATASLQLPEHSTLLDFKKGE